MQSAKKKTPPTADPEQEVFVTTLADLDPEQIDMFTVVLIGNSQTYLSGNHMITPRGYYGEIKQKKMDTGIGQDIMIRSFRTIEKELKNQKIPLDKKWALLHAIQDVGMALSGNLQNFAGGLIVLLFKPYKVGDWIESQGVSGTVKEIQIFHTILTTADNKVIYVPNGAMSSGVVTNYSNQVTRRVEWIVGIDYGEDYDKVQEVVYEILAADKRILNEPAPFVALHALDASSVNVVARVWVNSSDYWGVYFDINKAIYETFNEKGINFPFPQLTVHQG